MKMLVDIILIMTISLHCYFLWLEMIAWESVGPKVFRGFSKEFFKSTKTLAANQGLYNGFLAAGLTWSLFIEDPVWQDHVALFFLSCVAVAGIYGGLTAGKKIFFVQGLPAIMGIVFLLLG